MRRSLGKSIKNTWSIVKRESIETPQDTLQRSLKIEKELGVPVQEGRDPLEGTRTLIDREVGETIDRDSRRDYSYETSRRDYSPERRSRRDYSPGQGQDSGRDRSRRDYTPEKNRRYPGQNR